MEKLSSARQAYLTLDQALRAPMHELKRDAVIQRFEYTTDSTWKAAKEVLLHKFGLDVRYPKEAFQKSFLTGMVDEVTVAALLKVVEDRNLTSHTYSLTTADEIYARIPAHAAALNTLLEALEQSKGN